MERKLKLNLFTQIKKNRRRKWVIAVPAFLLSTVCMFLYGFIIELLLMLCTGTFPGGPGFPQANGKVDPYIGSKVFSIIMRYHLMFWTVTVFLIFWFLRSIYLFSGDGSNVMRLNHAHQVSDVHADKYLNLMSDIEDMSMLVQLKQPKVYIIHDSSINALIAGKRNHSCLAVTDGALRRLTAPELEGVIAYELYQLKSGSLEVCRLGDIFAYPMESAGAYACKNAPAAICGSLDLLFVRLCEYCQMHLIKKQIQLCDEGSLYLARNPEENIHALKAASSVMGMQKNSLLCSNLYYVDPAGMEIHNINNIFDLHPHAKQRIKHIEQL